MSTLNEENTKFVYNCNGSTNVWDYNFTILNTTDIVVTKVDSLGNETNITSDFSVNDTLKKVTYPVVAAPIASGYKIVISRNVPDTQAYDFTSAGTFNTANITAEFNKLTMLIQDLKEPVDRSLKWRMDQITANTDANDFTGGSGTTPGATTWGDIEGTLSDQTDLNSALAGKSATSHNHSSTYSALGHDHSGTYSETSHNHSSTYSNKASSSTTGNFVTFTDSSGTIGNSAYNSSTFASSTHNHSGTYSEVGHNHSGTYQGLDTELTAFSNITLVGDSLPYATASDTMATTTFTAAARTLMDDSSTSAMLSTLGASASDHNHSSTYQGLDTELTAIAGLTSASDTAPYFTGSGTAALMTVTAAGRAILDDANAAAQRVTLGVSTRGIYVTIDGGTSTPTTGSRARITIPEACTITNWYVVADASGSCVVDVKRSGTTIIGAGNKPTLSSAQRANAAVASWTSVAISANDELEFYLDSVTTCKQIYITLVVTI